MKRMFIALLVVASVLGAIPSHAKGKARTPAPLVKIAVIDAPTGATGTVGNCKPTDGASCQKTVVARHHRCAYLTDSTKAQDGSTGKFGYLIELKGTEKHFTLSSVDKSADFDITFFKGLGTCAGAVPRAGGENPDQTFKGQFTFAAFGTQAEVGAMPAGAKFAIVTLWAAQQKQFNFTATYK